MVCRSKTRRWGGVGGGGVFHSPHFSKLLKLPHKSPLGSLTNPLTLQTLTEQCVRSWGWNQSSQCFWRIDHQHINTHNVSKVIRTLKKNKEAWQQKELAGRCDTAQDAQRRLHWQCDLLRENPQSGKRASHTVYQGKIPPGRGSISFRAVKWQDGNMLVEQQRPVWLQLNKRDSGKWAQKVNREAADPCRP